MNLKLDGRVHIGAFGDSADIYTKGRWKILVDKNSGEVICRYLFRKSSGDELRSVEEHRKEFKA